MDEPILREKTLVKVSQKISEGKKERIASFTGRITKVKGEGNNKTITVKNFFDGVVVERIFPVASPTIEKIQVIEETVAVKKRSIKKAAKKSSKK